MVFNIKNAIINGINISNRETTVFLDDKTAHTIKYIDHIQIRGDKGSIKEYESVYNKDKQMTTIKMSSDYYLKCVIRLSHHKDIGELETMLYCKPQKF